MLVINLFGGPNSGKSTTAAALFAEMKKRGMNVELVNEYAKDMVWEERGNILGDQLYILAKQNRKLRRLLGKVDYVVTDSPLLFGLVYGGQEPAAFEPLPRSYWDSYRNISFYLPRNTSFIYQAEGRVQKSHEEAATFDAIVRSISPWNVIELPISSDYVTEILEKLVICR